MCRICQIDRFKHFNGLLPDLAPPHAFQRAHIIEEPLCSKVIIDALQLRRIADELPPFASHFEDIFAVPENFAFRARHMVGHELHQCGFACTVRAEQSGYAWLQRKADIGERPKIAVLL